MCNIVDCRKTSKKNTRHYGRDYFTGTGLILAGTVPLTGFLFIAESQTESGTIRILGLGPELLIDDDQDQVEVVPQDIYGNQVSWFPGA